MMPIRNRNRHCMLSTLALLVLSSLATRITIAQAPPTAPAATPPAATSDPAKGKRLFQERCSLCHTVDAATAAQGPRLNGVVGRASASLTEFAYTDVLRRMR